MNEFYRIFGKISFPEGLAVGEERDSNTVAIARNGKGEAVLRGTSLTGAIRNSLKENGVPCDVIEQWFGKALETDESESFGSLVRVSDVVLETGNSEVRVHNMIDRHSGAVADKALFSVQLLPPETAGCLLIYIQPPKGVDASFILRALSNALNGELLLGGNRNRGIGRMDASMLKVLKVNVDTAEGFAKWQDVRYNDRCGKFTDEGESLVGEDLKYKLNLSLDLRIPAGEDLVVGYGTTMEGEQSAPQKVCKADGKMYWRIPGSTFRGIFRAWMTRLAKKDGFELRYQKQDDNNPDLIGWGGINSLEERKNIQNNPALLNDPILDLFGSLYKRGRIHFSDAYSVAEAKTGNLQQRKHVAIDAFSGGFVNGALFTNSVLVGNVCFKLNVSLIASQNLETWKREVLWLKKTLNALNLGIISVGSSKGSGLLEIANWEEVEKKLNKEIEGGV